MQPSLWPKNSVVLEDRLVLCTDPSFLSKVNSIFHWAEELVRPSFCPNPSDQREREWHNLDFRRSVSFYLSRTTSFRRCETLFRSFQTSCQGTKVTPSTIFRWIRDAIAEAYSAKSVSPPLGIVAHSLRGAATTAAYKTFPFFGSSVRAATWSSPHTPLLVTTRLKLTFYGTLPLVGRFYRV